MAESSFRRITALRLLWVLLALFIIFFQLLPLNTLPTKWPGPDLLVALTFAWAMRRPELVPALSVAFVMLLADFLLQRPPGLLAALIVAMTEALKLRGQALRDQPFGLEWVSVTVGLVVVTLAYRLILAILLIPQAAIGLTMIQVFMTLLCYPLIVAVSHYVFGLRKAAPGEVDHLGHRI